MVADFFAPKFPQCRPEAAVDTWRLVRMGKDDAEDREPLLDDLLEDPIARALMARDGVARGDVERLLARKRRQWFEEQD
jgi:hypothetical protein